MKVTSLNKRKICVLSKNEISSLSEFFRFSKNDQIKDVPYSNFSITEMEEFSPDTIIIDDYYTKSNYELIIDTIINKFPEKKVYVISPEYAEYNRVVTSPSGKNHFFSNLNETIIDLINSKQGNDPSSFLTAC
jgi:hypothetical protein